ncbi:MAG TPA: penicillin acylase family protein, partial [Acetobacteraceae bacterium]|nr:penicillin acylase family protein [Acetobacteraceae bacterium]
PEGPLPFTTREVQIRVRGQAPVTMRLRETRHGPVVSDLDPEPRRGEGTVLALAMAALAPADTPAIGLLALNRAGSIAEARAAAALITSPPQNLMVADAAGGIALFLTGRIPVRRTGDGTIPVRGWEGGPAWTGFLAFESLPHIEAPASGVIANANNRVAPPDHPAFLTRDWPGDWRFRRIGELLAARERHDPAGFAAMQADIHSVFAREALARFRALPRPEGIAGAALDRLRAWDGAMAADRPEPLIFHATLRRFGAAALAAGGVPAGAWEAAPEFLAHLLHRDGRGAPWCGAEGCDALLGAALRESVADLAARHGPDPAAWRWGPAHVARFEHPLLRFVPGLGALTRLATPTAGDGETLLRAAFRGGPDFANVHGAGLRIVADLGSPAGLRAVIATGQSGHPMSRHWGDQLPAWRDGATLELGLLGTDARSMLRLRPGP